jgi:hypothetical protein
MVAIVAVHASILRARHQRLVHVKFFGFDLAALDRIAERGAAAFRDDEPFPHVVVDDFLPAEIARRLVAEFPGADDPCWQRADRFGLVQPGKLDLPVDSTGLRRLPPFTRHVLSAFNSAEFILFLERITGIRHLIPDPYFVGGGVHQILPGGSLAVHVDFNFHPHLQVFRRINVLYYLNRRWKRSYGGFLELWSSDATRCVRSISPDFNRAVIFDIANAYHGHPAPLACPSGMSRKSLALYYYTAEPASCDARRHGVRWHTSPEAYLRVLEKRLQAQPELARHFHDVIELTVRGERPQSWTVDMRRLQVSRGQSAEATLRIEGTFDSLRDVFNSQVPLAQALSTGRLQVSGDIARLARCLQFALGNHG